MLYNNKEIRFEDLGGAHRRVYVNTVKAFRWEMDNWFNILANHLDEETKKQLPLTLEDAKEFICEKATNNFYLFNKYYPRTRFEEVKIVGKDFILQVIDHCFKKDAEGQCVATFMGW